MTTSIANLTSSPQEDFVIPKIKAFPLVPTAEIRVWNIHPIGGLDNSELISSITLNRAEVKDMYLGNPSKIKSQVFQTVECISV